MGLQQVCLITAHLFGCLVTVTVDYFLVYEPITSVANESHAFFFSVLSGHAVETPIFNGTTLPRLRTSRFGTSTYFSRGNKISRLVSSQPVHTGFASSCSIVDWSHYIRPRAKFPPEDPNDFSIIEPSKYTTPTVSLTPNLPRKRQAHFLSFAPIPSLLGSDRADFISWPASRQPCQLTTTPSNSRPPPL